MPLGNKDLKLAKKILFIVCLITISNLQLPHAAIAAKQVEINHGRGPVNTELKNHPQNTTLKEIIAINPKITNLPQNKELPYYTMYTTATAYTSRVEECDDDPFTAAWGSHVYWGMIASNYFPRGTKISLPDIPGFEQHFNNKMFSIEDTMNKRYFNRIDIWMPDLEMAKKFGTRYIEIKVYQ